MLVVLCASPASLTAQDRSRPGQSGQSVPVPESATEPQGFLVEPELVERFVIFSNRHFGNGEAKNGFYASLWNMIPGAGWFSGGPGYRRWYAGDRFFVDGSAAISTRGYKMAQARFEALRLAERLTLGTQARFQNFGHVRFFGEGPDSLESNRSEYGLESKNLVGYAIYRPHKVLAVGAELGWLSPSIRSSSEDQPGVRELFPADLVFAVDDQPSFLHSELSITADTRDFPGHPTRGSVARAAMTNYSDRDTGVFGFRRYETEGAHFIPLAGSRVVVALRGWLAGSDTSEGQAVPFYLQPSLGGHNTLRGYADYRFHDRNLLLVSAETRVAMMKHVDAAVFLDAGSVAPRLGELNLDRRSYGVGLRLHSRHQTYARFDVGRGAEGWRVILRLTDPFGLSRMSLRTADVPFVP